MNEFRGNGFTIYSGKLGDVISREDGIWLELRGCDTEKWDASLESALEIIA